MPLSLLSAGLPVTLADNQMKKVPYTDSAGSLMLILEYCRDEMTLKDKFYK